MCCVQGAKNGRRRPVCSVLEASILLGGIFMRFAIFITSFFSRTNVLGARRNLQGDIAATNTRTPETPTNRQTTEQKIAGLNCTGAVQRGSIRDSIHFHRLDSFSLSKGRTRRPECAANAKPERGSLSRKSEGIARGQ